LTIEFFFKNQVVCARLRIQLSGNAEGERLPLSRVALEASRAGATRPMRLEQRIAKHKTRILDIWFQVLAGTYPADTSHFLKRNQDCFTNPVGGTARQTMQTVLDELLDEADPEKLSQLLDPLIHIRAVQTMFTPSQAIAFVIDLKSIIRQVLGPDLQSPAQVAELQRFENRIDRLLLIAFDIFIRCREKIYHMKATEEQSKIYRAFARAGLVRENPEVLPDSDMS
jgi:hypothetical protein